MLNDIAAVSLADDWMFESDYTSYEKWTKDNYVVNAVLNIDGWEVSSTKAGRRKTEYCGKKLNISDKNALTYRSLMADW
jgi:hypothetical protein